MMQKGILLLASATFALCLPGFSSGVKASERQRVAIVSPGDASVLETLAAREIRRYVYLRTGRLLPLVQSRYALPERVHAILVAQKDRPIVRGPAKDSRLGPSLSVLGKQCYLLKTVERNGRKVVLVLGGDEVGTLYAAYRLAEHLGVRFYLHGDVLPDRRIPLQLPELDEHAQPLFDLRGIQPFHDFPEGPDWWNADDYKAIISQLPKLRMNFIALHTYPEGHPNAEPTVWIGLPDDVRPGGGVRFSYPASYQNTLRGNWGYAARKTSQFILGASQLFERDAYGADVMLGLCPQPDKPEDCNEVFHRTGTLLRDAFRHAQRLGIKTCVGTETPLTVPRRLQQRLKAMGKDPAPILPCFRSFTRESFSVRRRPIPSTTTGFGHPRDGPGRTPRTRWCKKRSPTSG